MARRQGPSGEEPRLGRAPVLSSCEFEDLGRRLIVIDGVAELLEVDAHLYLFLRLPSRAAAARALTMERRCLRACTSGAAAVLFTARLRCIAPRRRLPLVPSLPTAAYAEAEAASAALLSTLPNATVGKVCERRLLRGDVH